MRTCLECGSTLKLDKVFPATFKVKRRERYICLTSGCSFQETVTPSGEKWEVLEEKNLRDEMKKQKKSAREINNYESNIIS